MLKQNSPVRHRRVASAGITKLTPKNWREVRETSGSDGAKTRVQAHFILVAITIRKGRRILVLRDSPPTISPAAFSSSQ